MIKPHTVNKLEKYYTDNVINLISFKFFQVNLKLINLLNNNFNKSIT